MEAQCAEGYTGVPKASSLPWEKSQMFGTNYGYVQFEKEIELRLVFHMIVGDSQF